MFENVLFVFENVLLVHDHIQHIQAQSEEHACANAVASASSSASATPSAEPETQSVTCMSFVFVFVMWSFNYFSWMQESDAPKVKTKKKSKYVDYEVAPANGVYFLFDVETTGGKRNWDRIVALSFLSYDSDGNLLDHFSRKVNPGGVRINAICRGIHSK